MYDRIFSRVLFPAYDAGLRRRPTLRYLREYESQQWLSAGEIAELQLGKLRALLSHAAEDVPHFTEVMKSSGVQVDDIRGLEDLAALPVMTKQAVREDYAQFLSRSLAPSNLRKATGGSTGDPFQFEYTRESEFRRQAVMWRGYRWAGADLGRKTVYIWASPVSGKQGWARLKEIAFHRLFGRRYLDCFEMSDQRLPDFAGRLLKDRPKVIVAYVSAGTILAQWMLDHDFVIPSPEVVITGAEPLYEPQRDLLERAFRAPVFNTYGSREFMLIAAECSKHEGLHINADHLVVETVDESGQPIIDQPGKVVVTDLHNYGMPFIRYATGDVGQLVSRPCTCQRGLPLLSHIEGRELDIILFADGRRLPGEYFPHIFKDCPQVGRFQVVQERLEEIRVRIVLAAGAGADSIEAVRERLQHDLGDSIDIDLELVNEIPPTPAGKRRVTVSLLDEKR
jgi:phenylacetate-CoA ligase